MLLGYVNLNWGFSPGYFLKLRSCFINTTNNSLSIRIKRSEGAINVVDELFVSLNIFKRNACIPGRRVYQHNIVIRGTERVKNSVMLAILKLK